MEKIKEILNGLINATSPSGYECLGADALENLVGDTFDKIYTDNLGTVVLLKKSKKENAKKLLVDAHFDTVGLMVTRVYEGGFLGVCSLGGLDTSVLPSGEVTVYGNEEIYGIITSTPPHLKTGDSSSPKLKELYIDTGLTKEEAEKKIPVGSVATFRNKVEYINGDYVISAGLDDKSCLCALLYAASTLDPEKMEFDLYITASAQEETGKCGPSRAAYDIAPDLAIVTDVNFAKTGKDEDFEAIECKKGASIDISSVCTRKTIKSIMKHLTSEKIPYQVVCEPRATSTNADALSISTLGFPTVLMSIPLKAMHTPSEIVNLRDIKSLADIISSIATCKDIID
ncbi:MAG: hypothetical protein IJC80_04375 [Clostridia bacterium]|nr:hypothetical protein [Clostridia bacterium]